MDKRHMYMEEQVLQQKNIAKMRTLSYLVMYAYSVITKGYIWFTQIHGKNIMRQEKEPIMLNWNGL